MSMVRRPWVVSLQPHNTLRMRFMHVPSSDLGHFDILEDKSFIAPSGYLLVLLAFRRELELLNKYTYFFIYLG
jgi:hypothetical protein